MNYSTLMDQIREYVSESFLRHTNSNFHYHGFEHTESVVRAATEIGTFYKLSEEDLFVLLAAAWFHDISYYENAKDHEAAGARIAKFFLRSKLVNEDIIDAVKRTIRATRMPQRPTNLIEQIICDADLFHLGTEDFKVCNKLLKKEYEALKNEKFEKKEWRKSNIKFLREHRYHTEYARQKLDAGKQRNLTALLEKLDLLKEEELDTYKQDDVASERKFKSKEQHKTPEKGIETMFRVSSANHQRLSDMADNKAHIMITVNSIILSVIITFSLNGSERFSHLAGPTLLLLFVNVITLIFSVLATRPSIPKGTFSKEDLKMKKVNLLFFGNFYRMNLEQYTQGMFEMMDDWDFLYRSLIKDIYSQGVVLGKKYRLLRLAYNVFMFGIIISVIAFVIASWTHRNV